MISPFVYKFLKHVATGGVDGVCGNSALGSVVFECKDRASAARYNQGLGMLASRWATRLHKAGYVWHGTDKHGTAKVTIKPAGLAALKEYEDGQAPQE